MLHCYLITAFTHAALFLFGSAGLWHGGVGGSALVFATERNYNFAIRTLVGLLMFHSNMLALQA